MEKEKPYLDVSDIMEIMDCKRSKAYEYIRVIKEVSDVGRTKGRVMRQDFDRWAYGDKEFNAKAPSQSKESTNQGFVILPASYLNDGILNVKSVEAHDGLF